MRRIRFGFNIVIVLSIYLGLIGVLTAEKVMKDQPVYTYIMIALVLCATLIAIPFKYWVE